MSADDMLAAMTVDAARMFRVDDRVGRIAEGLDGDLVIFRGRPFAGHAPIETVIIDGREISR